MLPALGKPFRPVRLGKIRLLRKKIQPPINITFSKAFVLSLSKSVEKV
jgi:hypothetical protein